MKWPGVAELVCAAGGETRCVIRCVRGSFGSVGWLTCSHSVPAYRQIGAMLRTGQCHSSQGGLQRKEGKHLMVGLDSEWVVLWWDQARGQYFGFLENS